MIRRGSLALLCCLAVASAVHAHNLEVAYQFQPGWRVQVRGWYEGGDPASGARVRIEQTGGQVIREGRLDKHGICTLDITEAKEHKIVVSIAGHRAEVTIPAEVLHQQLTAGCVALLTTSPLQTAALLELQSPSAISAGHVEPFTDRPSSFPLTGVLIGVGALLIVAIALKLLAMRKPV
jgi:hypothetical protein